MYQACGAPSLHETVLRASVQGLRVVPLGLYPWTFLLGSLWVMKGHTRVISGPRGTTQDPMAPVGIRALALRVQVSKYEASTQHHDSGFKFQKANTINIWVPGTLRAGR